MGGVGGNVVWNSIACLQSHLEAIKKAKANELDFVLILEDDVKLAFDFSAKVSALIESVKSWDMIYLNGSPPYYTTEHNDLLKRVKRLSGAFAYLVHSRFYDMIIETLSESLRPCDGYYMDLQRESECYLSNEKLVKHLDGYSVRAEKIVVYPHLR